VFYLPRRRVLSPHEVTSSSTSLFFHSSVNTLGGARHGFPAVWLPHVGSFSGSCPLVVGVISAGLLLSFTGLIPWDSSPSVVWTSASNMERHAGSRGPGPRAHPLTNKRLASRAFLLAARRNADFYLLYPGVESLSSCLPSILSKRRGGISLSEACLRTRMLPTIVYRAYVVFPFAPRGHTYSP